MGVLFFIPIMVIYVSEKVGDRGCKGRGYLGGRPTSSPFLPDTIHPCPDST